MGCRLPARAVERPQTLGYGLVDSPVGQLAWTVEKFWAWTDCDGDPYTVFSREQLLDNASVYWFTATGASSGRLYLESAGPVASSDPAAAAILQMGEITVPSGCSVFPRGSAAVAAPGGNPFHESPLLEQAGAGRSLRRLRAAGDLRRRAASIVPSAPKTDRHADVGSTT